MKIVIKKFLMFLIFFKSKTVCWIFIHNYVFYYVFYLAFEWFFVVLKESVAHSKQKPKRR